MRQLFPEPVDDIDIEQCYLSDTREPHDGRPWLSVNMAVTADGATALDGRSGGIGGPADRLAFHALRSAADVILVGAGTARAEGYGPVLVPEAHRSIRAREGRDRPARLAIVSASCSFEPSARFLTEAAEPPLIYTVEGVDTERARPLASLAEIVRISTEQVDLSAVLDDLGERGMRSVVCEGGPSLNGHLIAADLVDEWCLTLAPTLSAGSSARAAHLAETTPPRPLVLDRLVSDGRDLLARYLAAGSISD